MATQGCRAGICASTVLACASFYNGHGVSQDHEEGLKWIRKAAEQGESNATTFLQQRRSSVSPAKVSSPRDPYFRLAFALGAAFGKIAKVSSPVTTVLQDRKAAEEYRKAAEQGFSAAQHSLGSCYYNGQGISRDYKEAVKWWHKAADQGHAPAQCSLGTCFYKGHGVPQDREEGLKWIRKAAEQGEPNATNFLQKLSVPFTRSAAFVWLVAVGAIMFCGSLWFVGTYHIVSSSKNGTMVIPKAIFTFKETFVSVDEICGLPYIVAQSRWPLALQALQREGILESDEARKTRIQTESRQRMGF